MRKQDRQGARTVAELNRRYNVKKGVSQAMGAATEAEKSAKVASQAASEAQQGLTDKVGKQDYDTVVDMINNATALVRLIANRLVIDSDNFTLTETGSVTAKDIKLENNDENGEYSVKIEDGVVKVRSPRKLIAEGQPEQIDLFHFNITDNVVYRLYISVYYDENFVWHLDGFGIAPVEE